MRNSITVNGSVYPAKFDVCWRCEGSGVHDCWEDGMTIYERDFEDEEFFDNYVSGTYSVKCTECNGLRVIKVIDLDKCTPEQKSEYEENEQCLWEMRELEMAERRMGC